MENKKVIVDQTDTSIIEGNLTELSAGMSALNTSMSNLNQAVSTGFQAELSSLAGMHSAIRTMQVGIASCDRSISFYGGLMASYGKILASYCNTFKSMISTVNAIAASIDDIKSEMEESGRRDLAKDIWDFISGILAPQKKCCPCSQSGTGGLGNLGDLFGGAKESGGGQLALPSADRKLLPAPSEPILLPAAGSGGAAELTDGVLGLFSDPGLLIDGIAQVTEAWDLNTQARNNNTAAGLAQIAATTDLSEVCTTSSSVAGVFGNAIAFLKTPLGATTAAITAAIAIGVLLYENWDEICAFAQTAWTYVQEKFQVFSNFLQGVFAKDWTEQFGAFGNILNAFFANVENVWNAVKMIFSGIVTFVKNVFAGDWKGAWDGIVQIFLGIWEGMQAAIKWPINGIIGVINGLVSAVVSGINGAIKALNKLKFTVPDWVPVIGGKYFGFNIGLLTAPQIPYLAKGAVLPANKPFLAMVGDQKHGTNIEAPLATIQDAVALVMNDQAAAMMAGFEAVVRAINEKNATLELDGREIWAAYNAYNRKAAVVRGHIGFRKLWSKDRSRVS